MVRKTLYKKLISAMLFATFAGGCQSIQHPIKMESKTVPASFDNSQDSVGIGRIAWKQYFSDVNLIALIEAALIKNQELNIALQEIEVLKIETRIRKAEYLPFVNLQVGAGIEKEGRYTRHGAVDEHGEILPGHRFPEPLPNYEIGVVASWELDIWKKLRNAKKAAALRYLAGREGRNFLVTNLIAEIADAYYELMALDNQLTIIQQNIDIQRGALDIVRQQKSAAKLTQLAVNRFEAQLLNTTNLQYEVRQRITETENRLSFLTGSFPDSIPRSSNQFDGIELDALSAGMPSQLFENRPDIRQAELNLAAAKLDVKAARANFYPAARLVGGLGLQAFDVSYLTHPESMLYNLAGDLVAPLLNRNAIKAQYNMASAKQVQAVYDYERAILNAYIEVSNQLSYARNLANSYALKQEEANILMQSVSVSNSLFRSARADYLEVLLTQREALESKMELIEIKERQLKAKVGVYRALGGGWN